MENNNSGANTNTILIVLVLLVLVGFGVWYMKSNPKAEDTNDFKIEIGGGETE